MTRMRPLWAFMPEVATAIVLVKSMELSSVRDQGRVWLRSHA
jgi:hypothetical protein